MSNNFSPRDRAARALDRILRKPKRAILGWQKSDTEIVIHAPGGLGRVYITWPEKGTRGYAVNRRGVPLARRLPILVVEDEPNVIVDIDTSDMAALAEVIGNEYGLYPHPLTSHSDISGGSAPGEGSVPVYNETLGEWEFGSLAHELGSHSDTDLAVPADGDAVVWDAVGGQWVPGSAGAVDSVNGQTGVVVLDSDDVAEGVTNRYVTADSLADTVVAAAAKTTPVDADLLPLVDSAASNVLKQLSWANVKATLKTYFDTLYATATGWIKADGTVPLTAEWDIGEDMAIRAERLEARDAEGLSIQDDGGNVAIFVEDGGSVGVRTTSPAYNIHIAQQTGVGKGLLLAGKEQYQEANGVDTDGVLLVAGVNRSGGNRQLWVIPSDHLGSATNGGFRLYAGTAITHMGGIAGDGAAELPIVINANGANVGFGSLGGAPQAPLHGHTGTGGMMFVTKTGIVGSAQTIIANGTGDVVRGAAGFFVLSDGSNAVTSTFTVTPGNNVSIVLGGTTWQLQCNANGALTVIRTAGGSTASITLLFCWL